MPEECKRRDLEGCFNLSDQNRTSQIASTSAHNLQSSIPIYSIDAIESMTALREYFSMLSVQHGPDKFVLVTDNAAPQKQQRIKQSRRQSCSTTTSDANKQYLKFSVVSQEDDKCPSRPKRTYDVDRCASETKCLRLQNTTTADARETSTLPCSSTNKNTHQERRQGLDCWSLNQTHFQYSRIITKTRENPTKDDLSTADLLPREARWKF